MQICLDGFQCQNLLSTGGVLVFINPRSQGILARDSLNVSIGRLELDKTISSEEEFVGAR